jgi:hypothetical protein
MPSLVGVNEVAQKTHNTSTDYLETTLGIGNEKSLFFCPNICLLHLMPSVDRNAVVSDWHQGQSLQLWQF